MNANDDVSSDIIDPREYHKDNLHVNRNRKRAHLSIFGLIKIIARCGGTNRWSKDGKVKKYHQNIRE